MRRLDRHEFKAWIEKKRIDAGKPPMTARAIAQRWRAYRRKFLASERRSPERTPRPIEPNVCTHKWVMKPYGLRCVIKQCGARLHGNAIALWKKHGPKGPMPAPPFVAKKGKSQRAIRRKMHRSAEQKKIGPATPADRIITQSQYTRELGMTRAEFFGAPAWSNPQIGREQKKKRNTRTHPSS